MIDLTNFVKINIDYRKSTDISGSRPRAVCFVKDGSFDKVIDSTNKADVQEYSVKSDEIAAFFYAGGSQLHCISAENITKAMIDKLDDEEVVLIVGSKVRIASDVLTANDSKDGIHKKIFVSYVSENTTSVEQHFGDIRVAADGDEYGSLGMIAAYLSNINAYESDSVYDYCFTELPELYGYLINDNEKFIALSNINVNCAITLAGKRVAVGGNATDGHSFVNEYMLILLQQTCSDKLAELLMTKLSGSSSVASIKAVLESELQKYVADGFLSVDKVWTAEDWAETYNSQKYTIIKKGTPLDKGYKVTVLPFASISKEDKLKHMAPPIYIVLADAYAIRKIEIKGQVE